MQDENNDDLSDFLPGMDDMLALQDREEEEEDILQGMNNDDDELEGDGMHNHDPVHPNPMDIRERTPLTILLRSFLRIHYTKVSVAIMLAYANYVLRSTKQVYITLVYLSTSKVSYIIFGNATISLCTGFFYLVVDTVLDGLRVMEAETIEDHLRWSIADTCFALTVFRPEINVTMIGMFLLLILAKTFHWAIDLRGNHLRVTDDVFPIHPETTDEQQQNIMSLASRFPILSFIIPNSLLRQLSSHHIPWMKWPHVKFLHLCWILLLFDLSTLYFCTSQLLAHGPSVYIYFGFEGAILLSSALSTITLFEIHIVDGVMNLLQRFHTETDYNTDEVKSETHHDHHRQELSPLQRLSQRITCTWRENRATLSISIELLAHAAKFLFSLTLFGTVLMYYGLPFSILREVYFSYLKLRERLTSFVSYRRLTRNMNERFESVESDSELDSAGRTCIICRDHMDVHGILGGCKKLPICGHIFHKHCLREWLVQQQTCPTCRGDIQANELKAKALLRLSRGQGERDTVQMHESNQEIGEVETCIEEHERITESLDKASSLFCDDSHDGEATEKNVFPGFYRIVEPNAARVVTFKPCRSGSKESYFCMENIKSLPSGKIVVCSEKRNFVWTKNQVVESLALIKTERGCFLRTPDGWISERDTVYLCSLSS